MRINYTTYDVRLGQDSINPRNHADSFHRLEFLPSNDDSAFGFLDPDEVIRACHLIPAFHYGPTEEFLGGESFGRASGELDDYRYFYINMYSISFFK